MQGAQGSGGSQGVQGAQGSTGASGPQGPVNVHTATVRGFDFAYNTPNILTGATLYTPTIGDILLDAWIEIDTAWDGTTPLVDASQFYSASGWWGFFGAGPLDATVADSAELDADGILSGSGAVRFSATGSPDLPVSSIPLSELFFADVTTASIGTSAQSVSYGRAVPAKFTSSNPVKVVVSQDGTTNGADPGSTQGAGVLYLVVASPL